MPSKCEAQLGAEGITKNKMDNMRTNYSVECYVVSEIERKLEAK